MKGLGIPLQGEQIGGLLHKSRFVKELNELPLAAILVTAIDHEGRMEGSDVALMRELATLSLLPLQASGGVGTLDDLRDLADAGVSATIVGMALYTGALGTRAVIEEFSE